LLDRGGDYALLPRPARRRVVGVRRTVLLSAWVVLAVVLLAAAAVLLVVPKDGREK
jgi:hypothetical protein